MRIPTRVYKCRSGHFTPAETSSQTPLCSRCGSRDFTHVLWFHPQRSQAETNWIQEAWSPAAGSSIALSWDLESGAVRFPTPYIVDDKEPELKIGQAQAVLDYLKMLKRSDGISDRQYEHERQSVLRRVIRTLRKQKRTSRENCSASGTTQNE